MYDNDATDWLNPNHIGIALRFFWSALPVRQWNPSGIAHIVIDAVWH